MEFSKLRAHLFLRLSIALMVLGILFKIMHYSYSQVLLIGGALGIAVFYSIQTLQKQSKTLVDYTRLFLVLTFLGHYIFRIFHFDYGYIFTALMQLALLLFLILYIKAVFFTKETPIKDDITSQPAKNTTKKGLSYLLYTIATISIIVGAQFKILHWEFENINGNILLTIGFIAVLIIVLLPSKNYN